MNITWSTKWSQPTTGLAVLILLPDLLAIWLMRRWRVQTEPHLTWLFVSSVATREEKVWKLRPKSIQHPLLETHTLPHDSWARKHQSTTRAGCEEFGCCKWTLKTAAGRTTETNLKLQLFLVCSNCLKGYWRVAAKAYWLDWQWVSSLLIQNNAFIMHTICFSKP